MGTQQCFLFIVKVLVAVNNVHSRVLPRECNNAFYLLLKYLSRSTMYMSRVLPWESNNAFYLLLKYLSRSTMCMSRVLPWERNNALYLLLRYICQCQQYAKHLSLQVNCPIFLSNINQIWLFSTDFPKTRRYKITRKSVQWQWRRYKQANGRT
jgi:hypothetical protein